MNRIVYRSITGYQLAQFENVDIAVAVEAVDGEVDISYATIVRKADEIGVDGLAEILQRAFDDPQLNRLCRLPLAMTGALRGTVGTRSYGSVFGAEAAPSLLPRNTALKALS
jgi:hypothetical protein